MVAVALQLRLRGPPTALRFDAEHVAGSISDLKVGRPDRVPLLEAEVQVLGLGRPSPSDEIEERRAKVLRPLQRVPEQKRETVLVGAKQVSPRTHRPPVDC